MPSTFFVSDHNLRVDIDREVPWAGMEDSQRFIKQLLCLVVGHASRFFIDLQPATASAVA